LGLSWRNELASEMVHKKYKTTPLEKSLKNRIFKTLTKDRTKRQARKSHLDEK
jgi:hypothetical protein